MKLNHFAAHLKPTECYKSHTHLLKKEFQVSPETVPSFFHQSLNPGLRDIQVGPAITLTVAPFTEHSLKHQADVV